MPPDPRVQPRWFQGVVALAYLLVVVGVAQWIDRDAHAGLMRPQTTASASDAAEAERCKVPAFAKAIGHEEMWKLHNHCK